MCFCLMIWLTLGQGATWYRRDSSLHPSAGTRADLSHFVQMQGASVCLGMGHSPLVAIWVVLFCVFWTSQWPVPDKAPEPKVLGLWTKLGEYLTWIFPIPLIRWRWRRKSSRCYNCEKHVGLVLHVQHWVWMQLEMHKLMMNGWSQTRPIW